MTGAPPWETSGDPLKPSQSLQGDRRAVVEEEGDLELVEEIGGERTAERGTANVME